MLATDTVLGGRYALDTLIGRGGVADVYRAEDRATAEPVAVKVLRNATNTDLHRFDREARTLERLDHPAIVRLRDDGDADGIPYLVLDLVDGEPLSTMLRDRPLSEDEVCVLGATLAGALAHAHALGIVHRDVKPGNVLVDRDGHAHLTDFGIARLIDAAGVTAITDTGFVVGTAGYLAPEQLRGAGTTPASDVYSLGLVLLEALSGERVFDGPPMEAAMARLERRPEIPDAAPWLASLLTTMTDVDPDRRPRAAAVADALAARAHGPADRTTVLPLIADATATVSTRAPVRRAPIAHRRRLAALVVLVAVLLALLLFTVGTGGPRSKPANADTSTTPTTAVAPVPTTAAVTTSPPATNPPKGAPAPKGDHKGRGKGG